MSAIRYAFGQKDVEFTGFLSNISDRANPVPVDLLNSIEAFVIFTRPDGTKVTKTARIIDDNADLRDGANIIWQDNDPDEPSVFDQRGNDWEYTVAVKFSNNKYIESPEREVFSVS